MSEAELLTVDDLAARFSVGPSTIRRWKSKGRLPPPATGPARREVRWSRESIDGWEAAGFTTDVAGFRATVLKLDAARAELRAIADDTNIRGDIRAMASVASEVIGNVRIPQGLRVGILETVLTRSDLQDGETVRVLTKHFKGILRDFT